jgi:molecular chaperone DnaK
VTARDQESGREQQVTISDSTNLSSDEVNRMVDEARRYAAEDALRREKVEARNRADSLAHQLERALKALAEEVPLQEKARCEQLIQETAGAVRDERVSRERYGQLASDLEQALRMISAVADRRDAGRWPRADEGVIDARLGKH